MEKPLDLDQALSGQLCLQCGKPRIVPIDIEDGCEVAFRCPQPQCTWYGRAPLPPIKKKIIYLDTSTASHIVRSVMRDESSSPWIKLYERLRSAVTDNVICCPASSIVEDEAELWEFSDKIIDLSNELGDPDLNSQLEIWEAQALRALDRYVKNEPPSLENSPPLEDAFDENVNSWRSYSRILYKTKLPKGWIETRRKNKVWVRDEIEKIYRGYIADGLTFDEISEIEARGFGRAQALDGERSIRVRAGVEAPVSEMDYFGNSLPGLFDTIMSYLIKNQKLGHTEAFEKATHFLLSDHFKLIPVSNIGGKLQAAVGLSLAGRYPRIPDDSDQYDISHLETYVPYVDILISDSYFANICNQNTIGIGKIYGTEIRALSPGLIPQFIEEIDNLVSSAFQAEFSRKIRKAIRDGGLGQQIAKVAETFLGKIGIKYRSDL